MLIDLNKAPLQTETEQTPPAITRDPLGAFGEEIQAAGLPAPREIFGDGKLHRFDVKKRNDQAGWYVLYIDGGIPAGAFGSWQTGAKYNWSAKSKSEMSDVERELFSRRIEAARAAREAEQVKIHSRTRDRVNKVWQNAGPVDGHPYLTDKGVAAHGIKQAGNYLVIPFYDTAGVIHSLQWIDPEGGKKFEFGGKIDGNFFVIRGNDAEVFIAEGYATGATIHELTGATVVVAFNAGNLMPVGRHARTMFPSAPITFAADNDQWKPEAGNPGVDKAKKAAVEIGARVVVPEFANPDPEKRPTDFNDLARLEGAEVVKKAVRAAGLSIVEWSVDIAYQGEAPERKFLIADTFPLGAVMVLAAMGDAGKGMLSLDLGLSIAAETPPGNVLYRPQAFGHEIREQGSVVIFTAEDDRAEVHRRLQGIAGGPGFDRAKHVGRRLMVVPLPNAGGPFSLVSPGKNGPEATHAFFTIRQQLLAVPDLKLIVFDPLSSFCTADINADPAVGSFTTGLLSALATDTGASIMVAHHVNKGFSDKPIRSPEQVRALIRGTSAIVDGVRAAYVFWPQETQDARRVCRALKTDYAPAKVFNGALAKSNGPGDRTQKSYVRRDNGLLVCESETIKRVKLTKDEIFQILRDDIEAAAIAGRPFTKTGLSGLHERKHELTEGVRFGRDTLISLCDEMLAEKIIGQAIAKGSSVPKWLDVPGGPFDNGVGVFEHGGAKDFDN